MDSTGLLLHYSLVYVSKSLRMSVLQQHHNAPLAGHSGVLKTLELLIRNYWFLGIKSFVKDYINSCFLCQQAKALHHLYHRELASLSVLTSLWKRLSCNFITDLPISNGHDSILVFVDRMTKMSHFILCFKSTSALEFAQFFISYIVKLHSFFDSIVSDCGSIFTSNFWFTLTFILQIGPRKSTASRTLDFSYLSPFNNYRNFKQLQATIISKSGNNSCLKLLEVAIIVIVEVFVSWCNRVQRHWSSKTMQFKNK